MGLRQPIVIVAIVGVGVCFGLDGCAATDVGPAAAAAAPGLGDDVREKLELAVAEDPPPLDDSARGSLGSPADVVADGSEMVRVPGGAFLDRDIAAFEYDVVEVTCQQYGACQQAGSCSPVGVDSQCSKPASERYPVTDISWFQAEAFCQWAGKRLPTSEEWEWAARGREQARSYPWGDVPAPTCEVAVISDSAGIGGCGSNSPLPVASRSRGRSRDGCFDLLGNVLEWTSTAAPHSGRSGRAQTMPAGERVLRGGDYLNDEGEALENQVNGTTDGANVHYAGYGVRCARDLED